MKLPVLYAKAKNGKIKQWFIETDNEYLIISHGYTDGKKTVDERICKGKNVGRANATTPEQQAELEARSRWNKQKDKGYVENVEDFVLVAEQRPMLASNYLDKSHLIIYPCYSQPKLDGVRAIAKVDIANGVVELISRGAKKYPVPRKIKRDLLWLAKITGFTTFDGEVYKHGLPLQNIVSAIKVEGEDTDSLAYHIFDIPSDKPFNLRVLDLYLVTETLRSNSRNVALEVVKTHYITDENDARWHLSHYEEEGYEGLILRNMMGLYEYNHRSNNLQKWKNMQDAEAFVVDVEADSIGEGVLICRWDREGKTNFFRCKMRGTHDERSFDASKKLIGSYVTFRFQQLTVDENPQFPVGIAVRECDSSGNPLY